MKIDLRELTKFEEDLLNTAHDLDKGKHTKKFLRSTGNKLKRRTLKHAKASVKPVTGNLFKGIKRGRPYKYRGDGAWSVRVYAGKPAYHAHLVDRGHRLVIKGKEIKFIKGKHFFESGAKEYEPQFYDDTQNFIDKMLDNHGL